MTTETTEPIEPTTTIITHNMHARKYFTSQREECDRTVEVKKERWNVMFMINVCD